jgi:restriction system protein
MNPSSLKPRAVNRISMPIMYSPGREFGDSHAAFIDTYLEDDARRASVIAGPGMGKTTIALRIASEMVRRQRTDFALVLSGASALTDQLIRRGGELGLRLESTAKLIVDVPAGFCVAARRLESSDVGDKVLEIGTHSSLFILVDEAHHTGSRMPAFVSHLLDRHPRSRLLALITPHQTFLHQLSRSEDQWRTLIDVEYLFQPYRREGPELLLQTVVIARTETDEGRLIEAVSEPWFEIIRQMLREPAVIYQISPRKWEEIVAGAYKRAGFDEVILTPASGDRGRDVIATKYGLGNVRVIDQVKAFKPGHLVTANDVRALVGVLHTDGASKGFLTTTSGFAPRLLADPLIAPLMPSRLELVDGTRLVQRLKELAAHKLVNFKGHER